MNEPTLFSGNKIEWKLPSLARQVRWAWKANPYKPFNDKYRCVFIHIPKCAGLSIAASLFGADSSDVAQHVTHRTAIEFILRHPFKFQSYFSFAFVRHPYTRFCSAFSFLKGGGINRSDKRYAETILMNCHSIKDFVYKLRDPRFKREALNYVHFRPQVHFITFRKCVLVNFIGRYENLREDYEFVRSQIGVGGNLQWNNRRTTYDNCDMDHDVLETVYDIYQLDFLLLGYDRDP